ncbi:monovalent cation/H+ antiporter subunit D [Stutzerimonas kirkiae]|uniref:monovalent cation/H+ antiporter subunit D n=1 Tax=Stutzerimonas kirkiae TaxID=2211392 RepID=UPI0010382E00|nr:monovalent cation/H+ antiporter subunit D [Stutzerimonas kirkiae]TBV12205.1 monovalent cation/H+ antiporter subunit D [Stutzerimonas kirkiae]
MNHALILPILVPLLAGSLLLIGHRLGKSAKRLFSILATLGLLPIAIHLVGLASDDQLRLYALGNWQAPFGIVLLLDRLSAILLLLTAVLALFVAIYASRGDDLRGQNFHALLQFQLVGINGAFLTGDLFNLFVFFEILLISSYALLLHGQGPDRTRAGLHYVVLNLLGSSFFLIGVSLLYGLTGTLNMADLALRVGQAGPDQAPLLAAGGFLLLIVFALKAAIMPLYLWLPKTYSAATAPVAALFAIMTKVGFYAILRVHTLIFGEQAGLVANLAHDLLWWLALLTLVAGVLGVLAARSLAQVVSYLVVVSVGTLLAGFALGSPAALAASLYYLLHSTLIAAALFLLVDLIARQRGAFHGALMPSAAVRQPLLLGSLFFIAAISVIGLPPFSGFIGKVMLLRAAGIGAQGLMLWAVVLLGGLGTLIALSRTGSLVFWRSFGSPLQSTESADAWRLLATLGLLSGSVLLLALAEPLNAYLQATVAQLLEPERYIQRVMGGAE